MILHALFAVALHLSPCNIAGAPIRCGTFDVPESAFSKRTLHLRLTVLPATQRNESPIFLFAGGPGESATSAAGIEVKEFAAERRLHDIVLLDERGLEGSAQCPAALEAHDREEVEGDLFPIALVTDCRKEIAEKADLERYTLDEFCDDVEALRHALGYGPINIVGLSFGTRAALQFEKRYRGSVRSMALYGPLPPDNKAPLNFARDAQTVLDQIIAPADVMKALAKLPADIASAGYTIHMSRAAFAEYLRSKLYTVESQKEVPQLIHDAAAGNWSAIAPGFIAYRKRFYRNLGVFLTVTCSSDVRHINPMEVAPAVTGTIFGADRVSAQMEACKAWHQDVLPTLEVSQADVPILVFVGDKDAVTPKRWADALASEAPRVRTIVLANAGHADFDADCAPSIETQFFDAGSFDKLDTSCPPKP